MGNKIDTDNELALTESSMMSVRLHELIEAVEDSGDESGDTAFNLEVRTVDGRFYSLPYCEHNYGSIVLMDDTLIPPRPRAIAMRHVVEMAIAPTLESKVVWS
jgi:hypothetical protein